MSSLYDDTILRDDPWGYWKLEEPSGTFMDSSGNGRHSTGATGSINRGLEPLTPFLNPGIQFYTTSTYINLPGPGSMGNGVNFTIEIWGLYTGGSGGSGTYVWCNHAATQSRTMMHVSTNQVHWNSAGGSNSRQFGYGSSLIDGIQPNYYAMSCDGSGNIKQYVNGQLTGETVVPSNYRGGSGTHRIGRPPDTFWGQAYGYFSNCALYMGQVLTPEQILRHYHAGTGILASNLFGGYGY